MSRTLIAVPSHDYVHADFTRCLMELEKPEGTGFAMITATLVYTARTMIANKAVEMGFDQVPTASIWGNAFGHNEFETMGWSKEKLDPELLKGFMTVPWTFTQPEFEHYLKLDADMFYQARKWHYPESFEK